MVTPETAGMWERGMHPSIIRGIFPARRSTPIPLKATRIRLATRKSWLRMQANMAATSSLVSIAWTTLDVSLIISLDSFPGKAVSRVDDGADTQRMYHAAYISPHALFAEAFKDNLSNEERVKRPHERVDEGANLREIVQGRILHLTNIQTLSDTFIDSVAQRSVLLERRMLDD
ncbi:hypothetical protein BV25DRAFT_1843552 [Artomyces pyxidatus]|uniref:Uncharacterized protein n=1 Tax=Artomyces pyxidatus TaxID=48021 RepID=A0ACB8SFX7_9AGAM|nr:hypothetical protein BV25DRAFT_1843552 [Artomyces pyxidatus]